MTALAYQYTMGGMAMAAFVKFENVRKVYQMGEISIEALRDATFEIDK